MRNFAFEVNRQTSGYIYELIPLKKYEDRRHSAVVRPKRKQHRKGKKAKELEAVQMQTAKDICGGLRFARALRRYERAKLGISILNTGRGVSKRMWFSYRMQKTAKLKRQKLQEMPHRISATEYEALSMGSSNTILLIAKQTCVDCKVSATRKKHEHL